MKKTRKVKKSTGKKKVASDVPLPPPKKVNVLPRVIVVISVLLLLVLVALVYRLSTVGRVISTGEVPLIETVNLDQIEFQQVNVAENSNFNVTLMTTTKKAVNMMIGLLKLDDNTIHYNISFEKNGVVTEGLLSDDFSTSGDIFLDDDATADLNLNYGAGYLTVVNPHYVAPDYSNVTMFTMKGKTVYDKVFYVNKNELQQYWFNISSTKKPVVTAMWDNGTLLSPSDFFENTSGDVFAEYQLNWTPMTQNAFGLHVKAVVDDKETIKNYIFAVGNIVYILKEPNHVTVKMYKINSTAFGSSLLFSNETDLVQPFSLPCGEVDLDQIESKVNISKVYAYNFGVEEWRAGVPSEFHVLVPGKGYVMRLKEHVNPLMLNVVCPLPATDVSTPDYSPLLKLPTLNSGWNLVGIGGYESLSLSSLDKLVSAGKTISVIHETFNGMELGKPTELEPGVAYWVKVN